MQKRERAGGGWALWRERLDALQIRPGAGGSHWLEGAHAGAGARERGQGGARHITGPSKIVFSPRGLFVCFAGGIYTL